LQRAIKDEGLLANVQGERRTSWRAPSTTGLGNHRHVGDIRGRGLLWGIELVGRPATKVPFIQPASSMRG